MKQKLISIILIANKFCKSVYVLKHYICEVSRNMSERTGVHSFQDFFFTTALLTVHFKHSMAQKIKYTSEVDMGKEQHIC